MKLFFHSEQLKHRPASYYSRGKMRQPQEKPERMYELLKTVERLNLPIFTAKDFGTKPLLEVHTMGYLDFLQNAYKEWTALPEDWGDEVLSNIFIRENNREIGILAKAAKYLADGSAPIGKDTWISVYWSAQTALSCADAIAKEGEQLAIGLTRPAGHHARKDGAGGFCYVNNAAVIAQYLKKYYSRIAIVDTDMHHGQGIQEIFYDRSDVLYVSVHGDPTNFYPVVTGFADEYGVGEGYGYNKNYPMPHGSSENTFFKFLDKAVDFVKIFQPEVVIHVMGFDVFVDDPQAKCAVSTSGFQNIAEKIKSIGVPTISLIEGGYCIEKLDENFESFLKGFDIQSSYTRGEKQEVGII
ncbi:MULTISPECIES: histone deacetylase family protein [Acinetobacter calcoaceticus/baumannii complex]|uniref:Histone deacetylase family protein n=1 Tax=Acinetobacter pittii TaxID=48296 RepID=A0A6H0FXU4_ACIPI|nr:MULTISPECIES: histone deacetylase family protein [Acinetobacter calcoaceticus/baumannii complex]EXE62901.1 acetylpolyamine aminohydrolase [Acinetobacter sp. 1542444]MBN6537380.1 histone deacetylase family protein [Acinetobacter pittii]MDV8152065.1 histone deacetylase family protein [Acinetobacter pittii]OCY42484.1 acetylpolyamine aminohydrolase [Acinetobacter pittii]ODL99535.1 acetylpolyamine aminohydrolase [Acinetobacter pittii]